MARRKVNFVSSTLLALIFLLDSSSWLTVQVVDAGFQIGNERAFFTTKQMSSGVSHRQNVCDRYHEFRNGTVELKDALKGLQLHVLMGAYSGAYFHYDDENGINVDDPGIAAVLMDELARRGQFTWRDTFGVFYDPAGAAFNESWTDVLAWGIDTYDINVDWWAKNLDRMNMGVAFLKEWYDSSIIMVGKEEPETVIDTTIELTDLWNWTKPFDWRVWVVTVFTVILSGLVYQWLELLANERRGRNFWLWFSESLYLSAMNFTQAYEYGTPKSVASKIFGFSMALWALVMTATYTANLASLLVDRKPPALKIETVEEAAVFGYPLCTLAGTNSDEYIKQTYMSAIRKEKATIKEVYDGINTGECAFAVEVTQSWLGLKNIREYNPNCDLEWVGGDRKVQTVSAGFATKADAGFKCTSLIRDVINFHMEQLIQDGFLESAWNRENRRSQDIDCQTFRPELLNELNEDEGDEEGEDGEGDENSNNQRIRRSLAAKQSKDSSAEVDFTSRRDVRRRQLKAATKAASASASLETSGGGEGNSDQLYLEQMIGTFVFHWTLMIISIMVAYGKLYYRNYETMRGIKPGTSADTQIMENGDCSRDDKEKAIADAGIINTGKLEIPSNDLILLKGQLAALNQSQVTMAKCQKQMLEEQQELRKQYQYLTSMLVGYE